MAAPERFAETSDSFPLHRGRRPYMAAQGRKGLNDLLAIIADEKDERGFLLAPGRSIRPRWMGRPLHSGPGPETRGAFIHQGLAEVRARGPQCS